MDITSIQGLIDLRNTLDRYASPEVVEWHFASVYNRWTRRALAFAGFGYPAATHPESLGNWKPAYTISVLANEEDDNESSRRMMESHSDEEEVRSKCAETTATASTHDLNSNGNSTNPRMGALRGVDRPFFHIDLVDAVDSAVRDAQSREGS
jgi:solute carrier family 26 (sodium-independent sulfate anion transporter), member 11